MGTIFFFFPLGMTQGYPGAADGGTGFHSGHFVHMRGLPFRASESDIASVSVLNFVQG